MSKEKETESSILQGGSQASTASDAGVYETWRVDKVYKHQVGRHGWTGKSPIDYSHVSNSRSFVLR